MALYVDGEIRGGRDRVSRALLLRLLLDVLDDFQDNKVDLERGKFQEVVLQSLRRDEVAKTKEECKDLTARLEAEKAKVKILEARFEGRY